MGCACGGNCACKRAEDAPIPSDPRVSPLTDGLHIPADSPALDLPRENAEIGGVDFKADSSPLPPDPRVSPLKKGLYTPSDTPTMAAEKKVWDEGTPRRGPYVFPKRKAYPIGNETHAKLALIYSTWPDNKPDAPEVRKKVFARYPELRKWFEDGKYAKKAESFAAEGNSYTNYQPLPDWPSAASHGRYSIPASERAEIDEYRVGPIYQIEGNLEWCNGGSGSDGHLNPHRHGEGPLCSYCGMNMETGSFSAESFGAESLQARQKRGALEKEIAEENDWVIEVCKANIWEGDGSIKCPNCKDYLNAGWHLRSWDLGNYYNWERLSDNEIKAALIRFPRGIACFQCGEVIQMYRNDNAVRGEDGLWTLPKSSKSESFGAECQVCKMEIIGEDGVALSKGHTGKMRRAHPDCMVKHWGKNWQNAESAFDRLEDEVADEYEEKGMSDKEAQKVGAAVAYKQGVKKYGKKIMSEAARKGVSAKSLKRAEIGPHVPTRIGATTTQRGVVKTYDSIPAGDGHVVGQFTANMDYAPSGMYGAESITDGIAKGFGSVLGIISGLIISGFAMNAVSTLTSDDEN